MFTWLCHSLLSNLPEASSKATQNGLCGCFLNEAFNRGTVESIVQYTAIVLYAVGTSKRAFHFKLFLHRGNMTHCLYDDVSELLISVSRSDHE